MLEFLNQSLKNLANIIGDKYQQSHEQWQKEQRAAQKQQADYINTQIQLQLQMELFTALSESTAPKCLRKLNYPADLLISGYSIDKTGTVGYYFLWEKSESFVTPFLLPVLTNIQNRLNIVLKTYQTRLYNQCVRMPSYEEYLLYNFPLTYKGFFIANCCDDTQNPQNYIKLTVVVNP